MNPKKVLEAISTVATIIGIAAQLLSGHVDNKRQELLIKEAVREELMKQLPKKD